MRHPILTVVVAALALLLAPQLSAREVVAFRDGRYLEVRTHKQYDAYIRLEVIPNAYVVCPVTHIVSIERDGRVVYASDRGDRQPQPADSRLSAKSHVVEMKRPRRGVSPRVEHDL